MTVKLYFLSNAERKVLANNLCGRGVSSNYKSECEVSSNDSAVGRILTPHSLPSRSPPACPLISQSTHHVHK